MATYAKEASEHLKDFDLTDEETEKICNAIESIANNLLDHLFKEVLNEEE